MREADYLAAGERFAREALPPVLRPEAMAHIAWHKQRGDTVVVVSGGFDVYLSQWCRTHGLELICSKLEVVGGTLTGRYDDAQCVGDEKPRRFRERYALVACDAIHACRGERRATPRCRAPRRNPPAVSFAAVDPLFQRGSCRGAE